MHRRGEVRLWTWYGRMALRVHAKGTAAAGQERAKAGSVLGCECTVPLVHIDQP